MKLKSEFIAHRTGDESFLVPAGGSAFSGVVKGNAILGEILARLQTDTTPEAIVKGLLEIYDADEAVIARDVDRALGELRRIGALDE